MSTDFNISLESVSTKEQSEAQLPVNFLSFGQITAEDVKVYIKQDVYKALETYAASDTQKEVGSILVGDYIQEYGKLHIIISDYIEAKYTDASASTLTFTHETWDYVHQQHEKKFADKKIIGWQHTHPSYGIFLSNYDLFIQENFFDLPFQIAYVIDPIQNLRGFFQWKDGKIEKLNGFYVYDEIGKPIKISQVPPKKTESKTKTKTGKLISVVTALLCIAVMILSICLINLNSKYQKQMAKYDEIILALGEQSMSLYNQTSIISDIQSQLDQGRIGKDGVISVTDLITMLEQHDDQLAEHTQLLEKLKELLLSSEEQDSQLVSFIAYTVQPGDSLEAICREHGIDYYANRKIILGVNGIKNPDIISVGQTILLPVIP